MFLLHSPHYNPNIRMLISLRLTPIVVKRTLTYQIMVENH